MTYKTVTKEEFYEFLKGKDYETLTSNTFDPPIKQIWNNQEMIAYICMEYLVDGKELKGEEAYIYRIKK